MGIFDTLKKSFSSALMGSPFTAGLRPNITKYKARPKSVPSGIIPFNERGNVVNGTSLQPIGSPVRPGPTAVAAAQPQPQPTASAPSTQPPPAYTPPRTFAPAPTVQRTPPPAFAPEAARQERAPEPVPAVPSVAAEGVKTAEERYYESLLPGEGEQKTQADLDRLISATRQGYTGIENKVIPMEFITGQLASLEGRALDLAEPLESKLTRLQAARSSALEASKFALKRADEKLKSETEADKPITIGSGSSLIERDPSTGEYKTVFQPRQSDEGAELLSPSEATSLGVPYGTTKEQAYGKQTSDLSPKQQTRVDNIRSQFVTNPIVKNYNEVVNKSYTVDQILQRGELGGPADLALVFEFMKALDPTSVVRESEYEAAAKSGNIFSGIFTRFNKGYFSPEGGILPEEVKKSFAELVKIKMDASTRQYDNYLSESGRLIDKITGTEGGTDWLPQFTLPGDQPPATLEEYYKANPNEQTSINQLITDNPQLSDEDIFQILGGGFNNVGGDTNTALNRPQRNNNPGNVKSGGVADQFATGTDDQGHLVFDSPEDGFKALSMDLQAKLSGRSQHVGANPTIAELGKVYAEDPNWPNSVAKMLGVSPTTKTGSVDFNNLVKAIATQEGFYA